MKPRITLKLLWLFVWVPAGLVAMVLWAPAQDEKMESVASVSFESFEIVTNRNIFNPNRQADRRKPSPEEAAAAATAASTSEGATSEESLDSFRSHEMALVGTLIDGPTAVAFFSSSSSDFKTVAQIGENVGEFRLAEIQTEYVKLDSNGKTIKLPVGSRMSSQRDGGWSIAANPRPVAAPKNSAETAPPKEEASVKPGDEAPAATAQGGGADDVLKRLMEKRRKALEK